MLVRSIFVNVLTCSMSSLRLQAIQKGRASSNRLSLYGCVEEVVFWVLG